MTQDMMTLRALLEKSSDADLLREMIGFTAERLMALEVEGLTGAGHGERSARQARIRRSRVRRTPGSRSECRCISASNTPTERMPGLFSRIGTTSVSKISARGSGRRRPRGATFPERRDGSSASRYPVARLKPAFAAATSIV